MEQTLLERVLESHLSSLGMKLGERIYAEDRDLKAEMEKILDPVESHEELNDRFANGKASIDRFLQGDQPLLTRTSSLKNGLVFMYMVEVDPEVYQGEAKGAADALIRNRNFGERYEILKIYFDEDIVGPTESQSQEALNRSMDEVYEMFQILSLKIEQNEKIRVRNYAKREDYKGCQQTRSALEGIEADFKGKIFDEKAAEILVRHLTELSELAKL